MGEWAGWLRRKEERRRRDGKGSCRAREESELQRQVKDQCSVSSSEVKCLLSPTSRSISPEHERRTRSRVVRS